MKLYGVILLLLFSLIGRSQENIFSVHDHNSLSQIYLDHITYEKDIYALGATICNTGECGVLSKYDEDGKLIFLKEIDNIDITSYKCIELINDTIMLVGLSKYEVGSRLQMYDLEGVLLMDSLIIRDVNLDYTWPLDVLFREDIIYLAVNENYENESRQTAVYKIDYEGNVLDHIRLPYHFRGGILTLAQLNNGNLFVTQPYIDEEVCIFEHEEDNRVNAVIFYEISEDSLEIVRSKENMCYQPTNSVSYDCTVLPNDNIIRNVIWRDSFNEDIIHAANIYYNSDWEEIALDKYPQVSIGTSLIAIGVLGNRSFESRNEDEYYIVASISYAQPDEDFPYIDFLIQKWDIDRNLLWERVFSDPNIHHRIYFNSLVETDSSILLAGYVWSDFDIGGTQDFALMSLDLEGCYNGDCSDTIYINGPPTSTYDIEEDNSILIFPNPVVDEIQVKSTFSLKNISIYSMDGTLVMERSVGLEEGRIDMTSLPSGMYLVKVLSDEGIGVRKVMKL